MVKKKIGKDDKLGKKEAIFGYIISIILPVLIIAPTAAHLTGFTLGEAAFISFIATVSAVSFYAIRNS